jgi:hypothetical protein
MEWRGPATRNHVRYRNAATNGIFVLGLLWLAIIVLCAAGSSADDAPPTSSPPPPPAASTSPTDSPSYDQNLDQGVAEAFASGEGSAVAASAADDDNSIAERPIDLTELSRRVARSLPEAASEAEGARLVVDAPPAGGADHPPLESVPPRHQPVPALQPRQLPPQHATSFQPQQPQQPAGKCTFSCPSPCVLCACACVSPLFFCPCCISYRGRGRRSSGAASRRGGSIAYARRHATGRGSSNRAGNTRLVCTFRMQLLPADCSPVCGSRCRLPMLRARA